MINESELFLLLHFIIVNKIYQIIYVVRLICANFLLICIFLSQLYQIYYVIECIN
jgi:hypothetical protein